MKLLLARFLQNYFNFFFKEQINILKMIKKSHVNNN